MFQILIVQCYTHKSKVQRTHILRVIQHKIVHMLCSKLLQILHRKNESSQNNI